MSKAMSGVDRIAAERRRQIEVEGWTAEHDDCHTESELLGAAICYAKQALTIGCSVSNRQSLSWPFCDNDWKPEPRDGGKIEPKHAIRMLEKAGALIAAEIDRLERLEASRS